MSGAEDTRKVEDKREIRIPQDTAEVHSLNTKRTILNNNDQAEHLVEDHLKMNAMVAAKKGLIANKTRRIGLKSWWHKDTC